MKDQIENLFQKGKTEKPPASLDNFILAQAKNSCDEKQFSTNKINKRRWLYSLSSAAVVVLSFSIIFNLQNENLGLSKQPEILNKTVSEPKQGMERVVNTPEKIIGRMAEDKDENNEISIPQAAPVVSPATEIFDDEIATESGMAYSEESEPATGSGIMADSIQSKANNPKSSERAVKKEVRYSAPLRIENLKESSENEQLKTIVDQKKSLQQLLEQLDELIKQEKFDDAKLLLIALKKQFPIYDFSQYNNLND